jgi:hypothetical protein
MNARFRLLSAMILLCMLVPAAHARKMKLKLDATAEIGFLAVASHRVQFSKDNTYFDYRDNGAQDVLFPVTRYSLDLALGRRQTVTLLYQPLRLETTDRLDDAILVDDLEFPAGTPVLFLYNFPFYRASWMYDLLKKKKSEASIGLSLQIRNATIVFASLDGELYRANRGIGPVPLLKFRGTWPVGKRTWIGTEIDGIYAPVSYLNGSDEEITGALLDASLRGGMSLRKYGETFLNLRYLAGGAVGTNEDDTGPGDGYVKNWLHFFTVTTGFTYHFR